MKLIATFLTIINLVSCEGRGPAGLLRSGDMPILDFPLYMSDTFNGTVYKVDREGNTEVIVSNLSGPKGITTDKFQSLYIVESGEGRLLKVDTNFDGEIDAGNCQTTKNDLGCLIVNDQFSAPSFVAVDGANEVYVTDDTTNSVVRANDNQTIETYDSTPSALEFGVNDTMVVALVDDSKIIWGTDTVTTEVFQPVGVGIDGAGRIYVIPSAGGSGLSECDTHFTGSENGVEMLYSETVYNQQAVNIVRFHQTEPGSSCGENVALGIKAPKGVAVDTVGNVFMTQQGADRGIILSPFSGNPKKFVTDSNFGTPFGLSFTKY